MKKASKKAPPVAAKMPTWNLGLIYASPTDPKIERDMAAFEKRAAEFAAAHDKPGAAYLTDHKALKEALEAYEKLMGSAVPPALVYFFMLRDIESSNPAAQANMALLESRLARAQNSLTFFEISLGQSPAARRDAAAKDPNLAHFKVFLSRVSQDARHMKSVAEERILNLKAQTSHEMWIAANDRILSGKTVSWKGKDVPLSQAIQTIPSLDASADREKLARALNAKLKEVAPISEAEINAVFTNKKVDDELRGFPEPFESTVLSYRNDPAAIRSLVEAVSDGFPIAHSFFRLKARLLKKKRLSYNDRAAKIGRIRTRFPFTESFERLKSVFGALDPKYRSFLEAYMAEGRIDALPRVGKRGGAYCISSYEAPTYVLLNDIGELRSFTTFAHEMGHAFHGELSQHQGPIYSNYSTSLAETASTLFEAIAAEAAFGNLTDEEKIVVLHDKISDDISTIFRQIACFGFEESLHAAVRAKGYVSHAEIAALHNEHMKRYLGPLFDMKDEDGYAFVYWEHIRRFFYVYTYAYGALVSKAMLRRYRADRSFWKKIEQFLSAGGNDSPESILKGIGIDVSSPTFWKEGLAEIAEDIARLERLVAARKRAGGTAKK